MLHIRNYMTNIIQSNDHTIIGSFAKTSPCYSTSGSLVSLWLCYQISTRTKILTFDWPSTQICRNVTWVIFEVLKGAWSNFSEWRLLFKWCIITQEIFVSNFSFKPVKSFRYMKRLHRKCLYLAVCVSLIMVIP